MNRLVVWGCGGAVLILLAAFQFGNYRFSPQTRNSEIEGSETSSLRSLDSTSARFVSWATSSASLIIDDGEEEEERGSQGAAMLQRVPFEWPQTAAPVNSVMNSLPRRFLTRAREQPLSYSPAAANGRISQEEVVALRNGFDQMLTAIENNIAREVFAETYPLVGTNFWTAWNTNMAGLRYVGTLRSAIVAGLNTLTNQVDYAPSTLTNAIKTRLNSSGFSAASGVAATVDNGEVSLTFATSDTFPAANVPVALDAGLPNLTLRFMGPTNAQTTVAGTFNFTAGVDGTGFYLDSTTTNFLLSTVTTITNLNTPVRFSRLPFTATDVSTNRTRIPLAFQIFFRDPNNDGRLRLSETSGGSDILNAGITGDTRLSMRLLSALPSSTLLPQVGTDLKLNWNFNGTVANPNDDNLAFGGVPAFSLEYNRVNLDSFFNNFAERVLREINQVTDPLQPLIDVFTTPIPLLSDLGSDEVTLLHILGVSETGVAAIGGITALANLASLADSFSGNENVFVDLGSFALFGDLREDHLTEVLGSPSRPPSATRDSDLNRFISDANGVSGLSFPVLSDARVIANLLLGRNATLFEWRSGAFEFQEEFSQFFPVLGPVGVTLGGRVGLKTEFGFGYDTQGLIDYVAGDSQNSDLFWNGFYGLATDEQGNPVTGITLNAGITAGLEANLVIASAGVEGDITASIGIYLDDESGDSGRVRGIALRNTALDDLFYASGSLSAGLRAYLEVGFPPFAVSYDFESPRITLISFDSKDDVTPVLATTIGNELVLNVGDRAPLRIHGDADDRVEEYYISADGGEVLIKAFGEEVTYPLPERITGGANLRADVLSADATVNVPVHFTGGPGFDSLRGGSANDLLEGNGGPDKLRGGLGNDIMRGGEENDTLIGGLGTDEFDGGPGLDIASWVDALFPLTLDLRTGTFSGAASGSTLISIERYAGTDHDDIMDGSDGDDSLLRGEGGNDTIRGHGGRDLLEGSGGNDIIEGGNEDDFIIGGSGADTLDGGSGMDTLSYLGALSPVTLSLLSGQGTRGDADGDTLFNFETLIGTGLPKEPGPGIFSGDDLEGSNLPDTIYGMEGSDVIRGAGGNDIIYGNHPDAMGFTQPGFDRDRIFGGEGNDLIYGQEDEDELDGELGNDHLDGGLGEDHLLTFDLLFIDFLDGGAGTNRLSADFSDKTNDFDFVVGTNNNWRFPDGDEFANIQTLGTLLTGTGNDYIQLSAGPEHAVWNKNISTGPGDDLVLTDWRGFYVIGTNFVRTADRFDGGDGIDTISFEQSIGGVTVNLASGGVGGFGTGITITNFENIVGTDYLDTLTGDATNNIFMPLLANPAAGGGLDRINGGGGVDILRVDYSTDPRVNAEGISMDPNATTGGEPIALGPNWDVPGSRMILFYNGVERFEITGGNASDRLYGEGVSWSGIPYEGYADRLIGLGGNDYIEGRLGDDYLDGGEGNDTLLAGAGNDIVIGGPGNDTITLLHIDNLFSRFGRDFVDAGPGDDIVSNLRGNIGDSTSAVASDKMQFDGGEGIDVLRADFGHMTEPFVFIDTNIQDIDLPNEGYIKNFERLGSLITGSGNDIIVLQGRDNNILSMRLGDDVVNPGLGIDTVYGGAGNDLLILDYSNFDEPGTAGVQFNSTNSRHERRRSSDNTILDSITIGSFEKMYATGTSKDDFITGLSGNDRIFGGGGNDLLRGSNGDDWLDGGPGADRLEGNHNNDTYIIDHPGDIASELSSQGTDTVRASINYSLPANIEHLILFGPAIEGTGNSAGNSISGNFENNVLRGEGGNDTLNGGGAAEEIDQLFGGIGADTFILGEGSSRFYDDYSPSTSGLAGYAIIADFTPSQNDRLRLAGAQSEYFLENSPFPELPGKAIFHDSNTNSLFDNSSDELIAILKSSESIALSNSLANATYTRQVDPAQVGLTGGLQVSVQSNSLSISFSISAAIPEGVRIEIQTSSDLGLSDPWTTLASKNGSAAWTGPISESPPSAERVTITMADIPIAPHQPAQFFRIKLSFL